MKTTVVSIQLPANANVVVHKGIIQKQYPLEILEGDWSTGDLEIYKISVLYQENVPE